MTTSRRRTGADCLPRTVNVCVVGGGVAGFASAIFAARAGLRVCLIEKSEFPRAKVCGGCLNGTAVSVLDELGAGSFLASHSSCLSRAVLHDRGRSAEIPIPISRGVGRDELDMKLLKLAYEAGVYVQTGRVAKVLPSTPGSSFRAVRVDDGAEVHADLVVASSGLSRASHARTDEITNVVADESRVGIGVVLDAAALLSRESIHMCIGDGGYVGLASAGGCRVSVAAAVSASLLRRSGGPRGAVSELLSTSRPQWAKQWADALPNEGWLATPALTRQSVRPAAWRLVEVGDSAGYVEPFTGEGMAWALLGGREAGSQAERWCEDPAAAIAEWPRILRKRTAVRKRVCRAIAWTLRRPTLTSVAVRVLAAAPVFGTAATIGTVSGSTRNARQSAPLPP